MSYDYQIERKEIFTEEGQVMFMKIRDFVKATLKSAGAVRMGSIINGAGVSGSTWTMMACLDRMIELGELREITGPECAGQHRVFVSKS